MGALTLPPRSDAEPIPELTGAEVQQAVAVQQASSAGAARQLRIVTKLRSLRKPKRRRPTNAVRFEVVTLDGRPARRASVRLKGATVSGGPKRRRTDARGGITLRVRLRSTKQVQVIASRKGYRSATLLVPIVKR